MLCTGETFHDNFHKEFITLGIIHYELTTIKVPLKNQRAPGCCIMIE